ncbi:hypothetical protein [Roseateles sp. P5_D6]
MSARGLIIQIHVVLSCGAMLCWLAALAAYAGAWRRHHRLIGRTFMGLVVASMVLAVGIAVDARNPFGAVTSLQPLVLCLSAGAQFLRSRWVVRALGWVGLLVAAGVLAGTWGLLNSHRLIDVIAFPWSALTQGALAVNDLRTAPGPRWRAHGHRMLAAGWFYLAEVGILTLDPHPSVIAWMIAAIVPIGGVLWVRRQPRSFGPAGPALTAGGANGASTSSLSA